MDDRMVLEMLADHSRRPRNYGELPAPDIEWETTNPQCVGPTHPEGDRVALQATLSEDGTVVEAVRFTGDGCTLSQAAASLLSTEMTDTPVADILEWDNEFIEERVGMDLTPSRLQCAELLLASFRRAIEAQGTDASSRVSEE